MKKWYSIFMLVFISCSAPRIEFKDDLCKSLPPHAIDKALEVFKAKDKKYSVLIFTSSYDNVNLSVVNNDSILYNDFLNSDESMGLTEAVRVNNSFDVEIKDIGEEYSFTLKKEYLKDYKYIYIKKNMFKKKRPYRITYSNILCGFK